MLYKILVKQFEANTKGATLKDQEGNVLQEADREEPTKMNDIIPTRTQTAEFMVYQELDSTGTQVVGYWTEEGKPFSFLSNKKVFEASIIDDEPANPEWYKPQ